MTHRYKKGDKVQLTYLADRKDVTVGKEYEIVEVDDSTLPYGITDDIGCDEWVYHDQVWQPNKRISGRYHGTGAYYAMHGINPFAKVEHTPDSTPEEFLEGALQIYRLMKEEQGNET